MPLPKPLSKQKILNAMAATLSNAAAARFLHVSYTHYKKYAKLYEDFETGKSLFDTHINWGGKGIPKFLKTTKKLTPLLDIIEGRVSSTHFQPEKIKYRLIEEGHLAEECSVCGFDERRVLDYKIPLLLHFKDGNKKNYNLDNITLLCYNDYFLQVGDVFSKLDEKQIESPREISKTTEKVDWEVNEYHLKKLKELGLDEEEEEDEYVVKL